MASFSLDGMILKQDNDFFFFLPNCQRIKNNKISLAEVQRDGHFHMLLVAK